MATEWKFYMQCPHNHTFTIELDRVFAVPEVCPDCRRAQMKMSWWKKRKMIKAFQGQLDSFSIEEQNP